MLDDVLLEIASNDPKDINDGKIRGLKLDKIKYYRRNFMILGKAQINSCKNMANKTYQRKIK